MTSLVRNNTLYSHIDLLMKAKSGTGKTLVFCTIILERYDVNINASQSLIVVPTREVAIQIEAYLNEIGYACSGKYFKILMYKLKAMHSIS